MNVRLENSGNAVRRPAGQKAYRIYGAAIFAVLAEASRVACEAVNKWSQMNPPCCLREVQARRRSKGHIAVLFGRRVRRQETREQNRHIQNGEQAQRGSDVSYGEAHAWSARSRGSAKYSRASATKFPARRSRVEHSTAPMTRWRSRAAIASSSSGPRPGQLIIASTTSDALSRAAIDSPSSERSGLAAALRASRKSSRRHPTPRARADWTNGAASSSMRLARTCRTSTGR